MSPETRSVTSMSPDPRPSSAMSTSRRRLEELDSALREFRLSTAQSREDLRSERQELGVLDNIQQTVSSLVRERYGVREARARKMTM